MEYVIFGAVIVSFLALYTIRCVLEERRRKRNFKKSLYANFGNTACKTYPDGRFDTIGARFRKRCQNASGTEHIIDDITWNDLEMDKVFQRMDYTYSAAGEEALYTLLRLPTADEEELAKRERLIRTFMEREDDRVRLQMLYAAIGRTGKYSIHEYMDYLENMQERKNTRHYGVLAAMIFSLVLCFTSHMSIGIVLLCGLLCYNLVTYFREKNEIDPYITTFGYILRILEMESKFSQCQIEAIADMVTDMDEKRKKFGKFRRFSYLLMQQNSMSGNPLDILLDYVRMGLHLNLIKFNTMLAECKKYKEDIVCMIETIGYIESMISVACYRASLNVYCIPVLEKDKSDFCVTEIFHPLLCEPVANSFHIKKGMLLTGSNASGKSTFLKTVAIGQIMAQSVHTVCAKDYAGTYRRVYTSMALRDSIEDSESYFIVEIKALKRIVEAVDCSGLPVMCFVDEVLRGTNTVERIAAASQILEQLAESGVFCCAATHDIELASLLKEWYENYHFEETIEENDIKFNYLLKQGKATSRNAIRLLSVLGYEENLVAKAEKRADLFLCSGEWK